MAARTRTKAPEPEVVETEEEGGLRSQMWKHEAMVEWINETEGIDLDRLPAAEVIAWANARRVAWRQTDVYNDLVEEHREEAAKVAKAKKEAAAKARAAKQAEEAEDAPAATGKATRGRKAKATAAPTKATRTRKATATADADSPFD